MVHHRRMSAAVLALGVLLSSCSGADEAEVQPTDAVSDDEVASSTTTTSPPSTTTTQPATTSVPQIDDRERGLLARFQDTYNAGDVDAFMALLAPDTEREIIIVNDRRVMTRDVLRELYLLEVGLRTEITLDCKAQNRTTAIACTPSRRDDLHRILGVAATEDAVWQLRFDDDGLIRSWSEARSAERADDNYAREVYAPFANWMLGTHPEVFGGGFRPTIGGDWVVENSDDILAMVTAFAESRGVVLDG